MSLQIKGFIETSFLDWDGKVVSTLYVAGCSFRCPFCHNSGLLFTPEKYELVPWEKIAAFLLERRDFIDGICLTGGEPCLHQENGLFEFLRQIKKLGFQIKLDSNGYQPECLEKIIAEKLVDYVAMDLKGPLDKRYDQLSGVKTDLSKIRSSLAIIQRSGLDYEFRTTVVPTLLYNGEIEAMAEEIKGAKKFVLQQFVPDHCLSGSLREIKPYSREKFVELAELAKKFVPNTCLRGV
ncbi:MAG: anaerobic ribonucleoside-triphosphate reductase activating protein [bacterium]